MNSLDLSTTLIAANAEQTDIAAAHWFKAHSVRSYSPSELQSPAIARAICAQPGAVLRHAILLFAMLDATPLIGVIRHAQANPNFAAQLHLALRDDGDSNGSSALLKARAQERFGILNQLLQMANFHEFVEPSIQALKRTHPINYDTEQPA